MIPAQPAPQHSVAQWHWPLDPTDYDHTPTLSAEEYTALEMVVHRLDAEGGHWHQQAHHALQRLFRPIYAVCSVNNASDQIQKLVAGRLGAEMYRRHRAFWGWNRDEWIETLCTNYTDFLQRHHDSLATRLYMIAVAYLLCDFTEVQRLGYIKASHLAPKVFGGKVVEATVQIVQETLLRWGFRASARNQWINALCWVLLVNRSPRLEDLTYEFLAALRESFMPEYLKGHLSTLSRVLTGLGILTRELPPRGSAQQQPGQSSDLLKDVPAEWASWAQKWRDTSTLAPKTRQSAYYELLRAGRWMAQEDLALLSPAQWTREHAAAYVAAVCRLTIGQFSQQKRHIPPEKIGKPLTPRGKNHVLSAIRMFFHDCQEWGWIPRRFDPGRSFATPRSVRASIGPDPRVISDDVWAKLLWAGLNLTMEDFMPIRVIQGQERKSFSWYPLEMLHALVIVWLFAGLRRDEICRLRVGCISWQHAHGEGINAGEVPQKQAICLLHVPVNKTNTAFTKPVDHAVGEAITAWEKVRPVQPSTVDPRTGEIVDFLFFYRGLPLGESYLNETLIPLLCRKAGIPERDARGPITSHRARSTIASQLVNAKKPMSLFEMQQWLGHKRPSSTMSYLSSSPTKLAKSYGDAEYFKQNLRMIEVLIDQETVKSGAAADGVPWKFYDLGHGYCTYEFFDQCPHRMACAKCSFYCPKGSTRAQLLEGKANLLRMLQEIPLSEDERAAVEDGLAAMEKLCQQLTHVPTPAGPTPHQLATGQRERRTVIPVEQVHRKR